MTGYEKWIGHRERRNEVVSERQLAHFRATFAGHLAEMAVPPGFHWTMVPDLVEPADLGRDGHPKTGIFFPALPLPRRMWAGGELEFAAPFAAGENVIRDSIVSDIKFKEGNSGSLGFVTINNLWSVNAAARVKERQDIVYREEPKPGSVARPAPAEPWQTDFSSTLTPDPVLLFRYSALTFNGHRIHYDRPYATDVEGYEGLVVHGPMQALLLLNIAASMFSALPSKFRYRGIAPLICGKTIALEARKTGEGLDLRVRTADGIVTMSAQATA